VNAKPSTESWKPNATPVADVRAHDRVADVFDRVADAIALLMQLLMYGRAIASYI
jgi:hypothetical protein